MRSVLLSPCAFPVLLEPNSLKLEIFSRVRVRIGFCSFSVPHKCSLLDKEGKGGGVVVVVKGIRIRSHLHH